MIKKSRTDADKCKPKKPKRRWPRAGVLARRAALGMAYAAGGLPVTLAAHWVMSR